MGEGVQSKILMSCNVFFVRLTAGKKPRMIVTVLVAVLDVCMPHADGAWKFVEHEALVPRLHAV